MIKLAEKYNLQERLTLIHNNIRCGGLANWYKAIHSCSDDEIIVQLDGDDWLAHENVLSYLNSIYSTQDVWITFGQFRIHPSNIVASQFSQPFTEEAIKQYFSEVLSYFTFKNHVRLAF